MTLTELFQKIGYTDKHTTHSYGYFYGPFLEPRKDTVKNFLEIGVAEFGGGCLKAFAEFFPGAQIHGIDVKDKPAHNSEKMIELPENVHFHLGDAYNEEVVKDAFGDTKWDVVLDDGPHTAESQLACLELYHTRMAEGGVIIIEDVNPANIGFIWQNFSGDKNRISLVDRRGCPHSNWDECIILYM